MTYPVTERATHSHVKTSAGSTKPNANRRRKRAQPTPASDVYRTESEFVGSFLAQLRFTTESRLRFATEFNFDRGRPDVIAVDQAGVLFAFEAKLKRWREALHQSNRNRCFANATYVVVPETTARLAARYEAEFRRRRVGLCYPAEDGLVQLIDAPHSEPWQPWLHQRATSEIERAAYGDVA